MKPLLITIASFALLILNYQNVAAKIWRVNNTGLPADFTTAQDAHDNANVLPGDTLYIEPSTTSYGNITINKRLTIISTGNFLDVNSNLQFRMDAGTLGSVEINAAGTVLHCKSANILINASAQNCGIERTFCKSSGNYALRVLGNNNLIANCYIDGYVNFESSTNNILTNSIVETYVRVYSDASATISNNVINATGSGNVGYFYSTLFENNIINKSTTYTFTNSIVRNNLTSNNTLPAGNGNLNNVNMSSVFVNPSGTNDVSFVLLGGNNPAKGTGFNGEDCGAFGGSSPYLLGLQAAIPAIYQLNVPATASGNTMNISFSTRSNN